MQLPFGLHALLRENNEEYKVKYKVFDKSYNLSDYVQWARQSNGPEVYGTLSTGEIYLFQDHVGKIEYGFKTVTNVDDSKWGDYESEIHIERDSSAPYIELMLKGVKRYLLYDCT